MKSVNLKDEDYSVLSNVGTNVRNARIKNRFTRKELAKKSGVSERYLAQLETGQGNASIVTLKNVCDALQLTLTDLLTEQNEYNSELSEIQNFLRDIQILKK